MVRFTIAERRALAADAKKVGLTLGGRLRDIWLGLHDLQSQGED